MNEATPTNAAAYLATVIHLERRRRGLSLQALAALVGTSKSNIWEIERGISMPSFLLTARLCAQLKLDIRKLSKECVALSPQPPMEACA